ARSSAVQSTSATVLSPDGDRSNWCRISFCSFGSWASASRYPSSSLRYGIGSQSLPPSISTQRSMLAPSAAQCPTRRLEVRKIETFGHVHHPLLVRSTTPGPEKRRRMHSSPDTTSMRSPTTTTRGVLNAGSCIKLEKLEDRRRAYRAARVQENPLTFS